MSTIGYVGEDPTYVQIDTTADSDPLRRRMVGTAVHGNVDFDVPFITKISDRLYMGGCENGLQLPAEVQHVISLYPWESYYGNSLRSFAQFRLLDSSEVPDAEFLTAVATLARQCMLNGVTLIHCQAGLNRSGLVTALVLMLGGMDAREAIALLRAKRSPAVLCNPYFEGFLLDYDVKAAAS
jgi:protein-tyrosine phosphatase